MSKQLNEVFSQIESLDYEFKLGLASGIETFYSLMNASEEYQLLLQNLNNRKQADLVKNRLLTLLFQKVEPNTSHSYDTSIAVYLFALSNKYPDKTKEILEMNLENEKLYWTRFALRQSSAVHVDHSN